MPILSIFALLIRFSLLQILLMDSNDFSLELSSYSLSLILLINLYSEDESFHISFLIFSSNKFGWVIASVINLEHVLFSEFKMRNLHSDIKKVYAFDFFSYFDIWLAIYWLVSNHVYFYSIWNFCYCIFCSWFVKYSWCIWSILTGGFI